MLLKFYKNINETGTDEAGRGCLAGPVTAAAIILPETFENSILTDSKLLSEHKRQLLEPLLKEDCICFGIAHIQPEIIDDINILNASILGMHHAIS
ncbi:MAG TPA: ribonuclease HII, partial [Maribacter sp.]|nr:ribonuclease HII [Maribacter sp.]